MFLKLTVGSNTFMMHFCVKTATISQMICNTITFQQSNAI